MSRAPIPLEEVAHELGISPDDVVNPVRYLRDLIRRHGVPFVRHGRTVKLRPDQIQFLAERMKQGGEVAKAAEPAPVRIKAVTYIYFILSGDLVKIGISVDPSKRLEALQTGNSSELRILHMSHGDKQREARLHALFADDHVRGEWFRYSDAIRSYLGEVS